MATESVFLYSGACLLSMAKCSSRGQTERRTQIPGNKGMSMVVNPTATTQTEALLSKATFNAQQLRKNIHIQH